MNSSLRLLITGPLPPSKGGVLVPVKHPVGLLTSLGLEVELIDASLIRKAGEFSVRNLNVFGYLARFWRSDVVHAHSRLNVLLIAHSMMALILRRPLLITLYSWRPRGWISRTLHAWIFKKAKTVVCESEPIAEQVASNAVAIRPAFISPALDTESGLPERNAERLDQQKGKGNVLIASDAVHRPAGTRPFASRKVGSFVAAAEREPDAFNSGLNDVESSPGDDSPEFYLSLYSEVKGVSKHP